MILLNTRTNSLLVKLEVIVVSFYKIKFFVDGVSLGLHGSYYVFIGRNTESVLQVIVTHFSLLNLKFLMCSEMVKMYPSEFVCLNLVSIDRIQPLFRFSAKARLLSRPVYLGSPNISFRYFEWEKNFYLVSHLSTNLRIF